MGVGVKRNCFAQHVVGLRPILQAWNDALQRICARCGVCSVAGCAVLCCDGGLPVFVCCAAHTAFSSTAARAVPSMTRPLRF
jgi:hypothetical protein